MNKERDGRFDWFEPLRFNSRRKRHLVCLVKKMKEIKIPIISSDLKQDEVCLRALYTFQLLDKTVDEVFNRIDARIAKNMTRLEDVNKRLRKFIFIVLVINSLSFRLDKAAAKIEYLKGSKKAIRIYSPAKYPIPNPPKFLPTHSDVTERSEINFDYNLQNVPFDSTEGKKHSDKLQFFHLKRSRPQPTEQRSLIHTTKSLNSLISFVNNENIIFNEPALRVRPKDPAPEINENDDTTDFSRFSSLMKNKHDAESFHYFPNMNQAPDIELPMDLPDLPGIADDISFSISDQELIAPSLAKMNIVNELPNVEKLIEAETNKKMQEAAKLETRDSEVAQQHVMAPAPITSNIPPPPPVPQNFIPMPPPPPMIPTTSAKKTDSVPTLPQTSDARSSLLQAIRNAGGKAKLRSVPAADEQEPQTTKKKPSAAPAGDLMSDLHAKLAMRRRGIAGSKEAKKEKASIMDKVSSMIPPPVKRDSTDDSNSSDSDWN